MTSINDPIRKASMFTMNGLIDPRFDNASVRKPEKPSKGRELKDYFSFFSMFEEVGMKRSIFRFKRLKM
jgi:hypothetical protein